MPLIPYSMNARAHFLARLHLIVQVYISEIVRHKICTSNRTPLVRNLIVGTW